MRAAEKCTMIREMVDRIVLAERNVTAWIDERIYSSTKCEKARATEMMNRAIIDKNILWQDFDETLEELMHE